MSIPLSITYRHLDHSPALESHILNKASRLERFRDQVIRCHLVIDAPNHSHQKGNGYRVTVETRVAGRTLVVKQKIRDSASGDDLYAGINRVMNRVYSQLRHYTERSGIQNGPGFRQVRRRQRRIHPEPLPAPEAAETGEPSSKASPAAC